MGAFFKSLIVLCLLGAVFYVILPSDGCTRLDRSNTLVSKTGKGFIGLADRISEEHSPFSPLDWNLAMQKLHEWQVDYFEMGECALSPEHYFPDAASDLLDELEDQTDEVLEWLHR